MLPNKATSHRIAQGIQRPPRRQRHTGPPNNDDGDLTFPLFFFQTEKITFTHIVVVQRLTGLAAFFFPVILPFFVAGAVDNVGIAGGASLDVATGAAGAAAFFLFFFVLVVAGGMASMGERTGGTMMTLVLLPEVSAM